MSYNNKNTVKIYWWAYHVSWCPLYVLLSLLYQSVVAFILCSHVVKNHVTNLQQLKLKSTEEKKTKEKIHISLTDLKKKTTKWNWQYLGVVWPFVCLMFKFQTVILCRCKDSQSLKAKQKKPLEYRYLYQL